MIIKIYNNIKTNNKNFLNNNNNNKKEMNKILHEIKFNLNAKTIPKMKKKTKFKQKNNLKIEP